MSVYVGLDVSMKETAIDPPPEKWSALRYGSLEP